MFSNSSCSVSPLPPPPTTSSFIDLCEVSSSSSSNNKIRRRSKSLDDLATKTKKDQDRLSCYLQEPTSPIITFQAATSTNKKPFIQRRRRHSLGGVIDMEYIRLAKIYGWVYHHQQSGSTTTTKQQQLKSSKSLSHIPVLSSNGSIGGAKLTRMFGRCTATTTSLLFPNKSTSTSSTKSAASIFKKKKSSSTDNDKEKEEKQQPLSQHLSVEEKEPITAKEVPEPPIENDPHVFDLLTKDSSHFIHYGKKNDDTTVTSATVEKLVEKLTREMDNEFLMDFFLTYRQFTTPIKLCKLLMLRFRWALLEPDNDRRVVRIRAFVVIRHWLTHYWTFDFLPSRTLRFMLSTFLTQLQTHPVILTSPRDERIIKSLRSVFKRQRNFYQNWSPSSSDNSDNKNAPAGYHRKDSAIGISSNRNSTVVEEKKDKWTSKVKRSIKRSVSTSTASSSATVNNDSASTLHTLMHSSSNSNITTSRSLLTRALMPHHHQQQPQHYKSIVLKYRSEIIAQQFCRIEQAMLQKVTWDELVELRWRKRSSKRQSFIIDLSQLEEDEDGLAAGGVDQLIGYFNQVCQWVASEIVLSQHLETRVKTIEKFIRIACKCFHHRNYSTLMQILLGLQSPAVSRLTRTWSKLDSCQLDLFTQLKELAKPFRNWKNVRDYMTKATEEVAESFAVESVLTGSLVQQEEEKKKKKKHGEEGQKGCIPFLGLYLSDLVFIAELPTFVDSHYISDEEEEEEDQEQDKELCERLCHHLVNYNKFRITASVVKHVLAFQVLSRNYSFKPHPTLYTQLSNFDLLDNLQIRKASFLCEES